MVSLFDVVLLPLTVLGWYLLIPDILISKDVSEPLTSKKQVIGFLLFSLFVMIPLGIWALYCGITSPTEFFDSTRGGMHGYTLAAIGSFVVALGVGASYRFIRKLITATKA